jgi:hypothetical protein
MTRRTDADGTGWPEPLPAPGRLERMTSTRVLGSTSAIALLLALAGCADRGSAATPEATSSAAAPGDAGTLVLQVRDVGGFMPPEAAAERLPAVSVYDDGRVIFDGPVTLQSPGNALPNVLVLELTPERVAELLDAAVTAGVPETTDLGTPQVAEAQTTRFTLVADGRTSVRDVYALGFGAAGTGLTPEQESARAELQAFAERLRLLDQEPAPDGSYPAVGYEAARVAAVVSPWSAPEGYEDVAPGPALPGERLGSGVLRCVVAEGDEARAVVEAASSAVSITPWVSGGDRWSVVFRPLLPHEHDCADLLE